MDRLTRLHLLIYLHCVLFLAPALPLAHADVILDWNAVIRQAIQLDRTHVDPGWSSKAMALANGAMYDALQAIERTHNPFLVNTTALPGASKEAAAARAAHTVMRYIYPDQAPLLDAALDQSLSTIPDGPGKSAGWALGESVANAYLAWRDNDGSEATTPYTPGTAPGKWRPDPLNPDQTAWGPGWGTVKTFTMISGAQFPVPPVPELTSLEYAEAFNEVKLLGAKNSPTRTSEQTEIGIFWAYDRAGMGPPPVIFNQAAAEIAIQYGNSMEDNARMFAMAMMAQADAAIAAWDSKYLDNFWRPITGIREADSDGNPLTEADPSWEPLGAPGGGSVPDFTPPFPAYVSGHATFGEAVFRTLAHFYGRDEMNFMLTSGELPGVVRSFSALSQASAENARSRIYLGIHWSFDDVEGRALGGKIADWVAENYFAPVPEPAGGTLAAPAFLAALCMGGAPQRARKRWLARGGDAAR